MHGCKMLCSPAQKHKFLERPKSVVPAREVGTVSEAIAGGRQGGLSLFGK